MDPHSEVGLRGFFGVATVKRFCLLRFLLISISATLGIPAHAGSPAPCSTEKVNDSCTVNIDRYYPVTLPTIQMRRGQKVKVEVANPLPFETLILDLQSAQALAGTDQTQAIVTAALAQVKGLVFALSTRTAFALSAEEIAAQSDEIEGKIAKLKKTMNNIPTRVDRFAQNAIAVYAELQEVLGTIPPQYLVEGKRLEGSPLFNSHTPPPWQNYVKWRKWMICELVGQDCPTSAPAPQPGGLLGDATNLANTIGTCPTQPADENSVSIDCKIKALKLQLPSDGKAKYLETMRKLDEEYSALSAENSALAAVIKDLGQYFWNIKELRGELSGPSYRHVQGSDRDHTVKDILVQTMGEVSDPADSATRGSFAAKLLGRQVVFSLNAVNEVGTFVASVPTAAQKKSIATITVVYADPTLEASAGAFFSALPNRSFANQTLITQNVGASPTPGNVVITQTLSRPTIVPFAAANWRLGHDFLIGRRRGAFYLTGAVGLNPYNTTTEFGIGPSLSWRALMFSLLYHEGHDIRLTQGEQVGDVWCNASAANASGSIPKCPGGTQPSPSTEKFWKGAFAFGISVRVPSVFGGGGASGH